MTNLLGLRGSNRGPVRIKTHSVERSILEAVFARGDRKLADAIEYAYKSGARFDGWDECFKPEIWGRAFDATGIDPAFYAHRERAYREIFPWAHLRAGPPSEYLLRQYQDLLAKLNARKPTSNPSAATTFHPA